MDPKIALLFLLIGAVIVLSHLSDENLGRMAANSLKGVGANSCHGGVELRQICLYASRVRNFRAFSLRVTPLQLPPSAGRARH